MLVLANFASMARAKYKPVDTSDIRGKQRMELMEAVKGVNKMPVPARDCFVAVRLGICFGKDGQGVGMQNNGRPIVNGDKAFFVRSNGRLAAWMDVAMPARSQWDRSYDEEKKFKQDAMLSLMTGRVNLVVRNTAKYLLETLPPEARWAMLATIGKLLYHKDGSSAYDGYVHEVTMDCGIKYQWVGDWNAFYVGPDGKERTARDALPRKYMEWYGVIFRCENLIGTRDILTLFPEEVKAMRRPHQQNIAEIEKQEEETIASSQDKIPKYEEGIAALRRMSTALRRAWLAENMGFCYTQSDAPAYMAHHIANDNALFVDEQGKECKLSEVATDKMAPDWAAATKAALAVGYEQIAAPFKEELKKLAVQTATYILNKMPKEVCFSWLSETNKLLFQADGKSIYPSSRQSSTIGYVTAQRFKISYAGRLYYSPQGRIEQAQWPEWSIWGTRWCTLFRCENLVGIEVINDSFKEDVKAMRAAYEKSPFYKR